jgi:hypothetical protein
MRSVRLFAKHLESWCSSAMANMPALVRDQRMVTVRMFTKALKRQTSLNHLAQAVKAIFSTNTLVQQMIRDWGRIDFGSIQVQARIAFHQTSSEEGAKWTKCKSRQKVPNPTSIPCV